MGRTFEKFPSAVTVWEQVVTQLVETLRYKPEGRGGSIPDGVVGIFYLHNTRIDSGIFPGG